MRLRRISATFIVLLLSLMCVPSWADYDVNTPHVIINQIYASTNGNISHSFIELYNPTEESVSLNGWAVHYRSSPADSVSSDKWYMTELDGEIPPRHSYLIRGAEDSNYTRTDRTLNDYDKLLRGGGGIYTKGVSVILTSNTTEIPQDAQIFDNTAKAPLISGYVDMLSVQGNDATDEQIPPAYETGYKAVQSKNVGIRRIKFQDTDDNSADTEAANYKATDITQIMPRSLASGEWGDEYASMLAEIESVKKSAPKFYATYCTTETANALTQAINAIDSAITNEADIETLAGLKSQLEEAVNGVKFKSDSKIAQIYVATDKGDGTSYGTSLTKAIGYVPAQLTVVGTDGGVMACDLSWAGQIKVRGNSTAGYAKRPYNVKFSSKVDLFGFGKSKKWSLLADYLDPTLMRNKIALELSEILGLDSTMAHQHVEVWVDGSYRGMYLLTEKIEADTNRVNIKTKNGDFLIETVVAGEEEEGNIYLTAASGQKFRLREPEPETEEEITEAVSKVKAKIDAFENVISSGEWDRIAASIDIDSFVSYHVLNEFMKTYDMGWPKSVYFHCKDGKYCAGPGWDFDYSSGNTSGNTTAEGLFMNNKIYYKHLVKHIEFQLKVSEKLSEVSSSMALLNDTVESACNLYSDAINRNNALWPLKAVKRASWNRTVDTTYEENVDFLKVWLKSRYEWMTDYFLNRIYISSESFPDSNFLAYVKTLDTNNNSFLDSSELKTITSINVSGQNIATLKGIELFPALNELDCTDNPALTQIDISACPLLFARNITYDSGTTITGATKPEFTGYSLLLSGQIGLNLYITIPDELITDDAYMQFTVNGEAQTPAMLHNADDLGGGKYKFTCFINSVQMADKVTAELHCGDNQIFTHDYRVKDYTDKALEIFPAESQDIRALIMAIKDYGHYVQPPLAANNKWTLGVKHAVMDCSDSDIASDSADVKAVLADYAMSGSSEGSGIAGISCSLTLDSETAINLYLVPASDYTGSVYAYLDDSNENVAVKQSDGNYIVNIGGISAHMLGDTYRIRVNAGGEFEVRVSALSYANAAMNSASMSQDMKKAAIALYKYYDATMNYRASPEYKH